MLNPYWQNSHNQEIKSLHQYKGHIGSVETVRFNPFDLNRFYSGSHDHTIKLWDLSTAKDLQTIEVHESGVWCIDLSSKDKLLASTSPDTNIVLTDTTSGQKVNSFKGNFTKGYWVEFSPDGHQLVASGMDGSIQLFDIKKGALYKDYKDDDTIVYNAKFVTNDRIICCTSKGDIILFDNNLNLLFKKNLTKTEIRTINVEGNKIFTSFRDNRVHELGFDKDSISSEEESEFDAHLDIVNVIKTYSERNLLFTGCKDSALHVWDLKTHAFKNNFVGHTDQIADIQIQKQENILLSASWDQTLRSYNIAEVHSP